MRRRKRTLLFWGERLLLAVSFLIFVLSRFWHPSRPTAEAVRARAERGDALAQLRLARMYGEGRGVPQDAVAATNGPHWSPVGGVAAAKLRDSIMHGMTAQQIVNAERWSAQAAVKMPKPPAPEDAPE